MFTKNEKIVNAVSDMVEKRIDTVTSLDLAKITGKWHKDVMRDIRQEIKRTDLECPDISRHFVLSTRVDCRGKVQPIYILDRVGVLWLIGRYGRYNYRIRKDLAELYTSMNDYGTIYKKY